MLLVRVSLNLFETNVHIVCFFSTGRAVHPEGGTPDTERGVLGLGDGQLADRGRRRLQPPRGRRPARHALHDVQVFELRSASCDTFPFKLG